MHNYKKIRKVHLTFRALPVSNDPSLNESTPGPSTANPEVPGSIKIVETDFCEPAGRTLLEMIQHPNDATKSLLLVWKNGQVRFAEKVKIGDQVFLPLPRNAAITRHLRLANGIESLESAKNLILQIVHFLSSTVELSTLELVVVSCFVVCTWLIEKLPFAPYVAFVGPPGSGKTTALRVLNLLCRRGLLTSDISPSAFYEICDRMTPTVLIDETATVDNRRKLFHVLRTGTSHDFVAFRKNRTFKLYGARAVSWLIPPNDEALNSRCLLITMASCKRTNLLPPNDARVLRVAESLQRKLLHFRLANFQTLTLPKLGDEEQLQPRTRDLFRALSMSLGDDEETQRLLFFSSRAKNRSESYFLLIRLLFWNRSTTSSIFLQNSIMSGWRLWLKV